MPMPLNQLLPQADSAVLIRELTLDSRKVLPGDLFLAVPGLQHDGRSHIADAIARGAAAVAYEAEGAALQPAGDAVLVPVRQLAMKAVAQRTDDAAALAEAIQRLRDQLADTGFTVGTRHSEQMQATGTNGKKIGRAHV